MNMGTCFFTFHPYSIYFSMIFPGTFQAGKFPTLVQHSDNLETKAMAFILMRECHGFEDGVYRYTHQIPRQWLSTAELRASLFGHLNKWSKLWVLQIGCGWISSIWGWRPIFADWISISVLQIPIGFRWLGISHCCHGRWQKCEARSSFSWRRSRVTAGGGWTGANSQVKSHILFQGGWKETCRQDNISSTMGLS